MSDQNLWKDVSVVQSHPRLFFKAADLPTLKKKSETPPGRALWERILRRCENSGDIPSLSLAYLITGNARFAERSKASIWKILEDPKEWDDPEFLAVNQRLMPVAIGYDWLYDYLTQEEQAEIRQVAMKKGVEFTYNAARQHPWWSNWTRCNWGLVIYSAAGVASLAFLGEEGGTSEYVEFFSGKLQMWLAEGGEDGGWGESLSYYSYAWLNGIRFIDALKNVSNGEVDFFRHPFMSKTFSYPLYLTMPDDSSFVNFSNLSGSISTTSPIMRKLAAEFQNPYAQWHANKTDGSSPFEFIWYDPHLEPEAPVELPRAKLFKTIHWAVMRTGWTDTDDIMFAMKGGHNDWDHHHLDHNTFVLNAYGERLIIDHGYAWPTPPDRIPYANDTKAHNTLLVNGNGQLDGATNYSGGRGAWQHFTPLSDFACSECYDGVTGSAKRAYAREQLWEYIRQVVFVRPGYFVIFDTAEADDPSIFEWLFHTFGNVSVDGDSAIITQPNASLAIKILSPEPVAYDIAEYSLDGSRNRFIKGNIDRCIKVRPAGQCRHTNLMAILYPFRTGEEEAAVVLLAEVQRIEEDNCVGAVIRRERITDVVLFDNGITERREPRGIAAAGISTDGYRCAVRREDNGRISGFAVHGGKELSADKVRLISAPQLITAAFALEMDGAKGCINLVATSTLQLHVSRKPDALLVDDNAVDFAFDEENQLVMFALSSGNHQVLVKRS
jgi:hypothetical protein